MAPIPRQVIVIDDDDDVLMTEVAAVTSKCSYKKQSAATAKNGDSHRRYSSVVSDTSSCTLGDDSDGKIELKRLRDSQSPPKLNSITPKKRSIDDDAEFIRRRLPFSATRPQEQSAISGQATYVGQESVGDVNEDEDVVIIRESKRENENIWDLEEQDEGFLREEVYGSEAPLENTSRIHKTNAFSRNAPTVHPFYNLETYDGHGALLSAETTVELHDGDFLKIKAILRNVDTGEVKFRGWHLRRCSEMFNMLPKKINELCYVFDVDLDDPRSVEEQGMIDVELSLIAMKRELISTNRHRPDNPWIGSQQFRESKEAAMTRIRESGILYVRQKFIRVWYNARDRINQEVYPNRYKTKRIEFLTEKECQADQSVSAEYLRFKWRGTTVLGGSGTNANRGGSQTRPEHPTRLYASSNTSRNSQNYTYGDTFSGGGGSTRGAKEAGLTIKYVMDGASFCIETLQANFPEAKIYCKWSNEFATLREDLRVDILHISPPCQVWSPAHTIPGQYDEQNFASLFAITALLRKIKPRIVTLEQTFGITAKRFEVPFNSLIHAFTTLGYSVSWQIVKLEDFGLPQSRKRLIMIAAGPGETLPDFPETTHSDNPSSGLKPHTTPRSVLRGIPRNASNHNVQGAYGPGNYARWDDLRIIQCITTGGGVSSSFPDGTRSLTHREFASLQGFPLNHEFFGKAIRKQIGNAVPPMVAKVWCMHIVKHMEHSDQLEVVEQAERKAKVERERIDLT